MKWLHFRRLSSLTVCPLSDSVSCQWTATLRRLTPCWSCGRPPSTGCARALGSPPGRLCRTWCWSPSCPSGPAAGSPWSQPWSGSLRHLKARIKGTLAEKLEAIKENHLFWCGWRGWRAWRDSEVGTWKAACVFREECLITSDHCDHFALKGSFERSFYLGAKCQMISSSKHLAKPPTPKTHSAFFVRGFAGCFFSFSGALKKFKHTHKKKIFEWIWGISRPANNLELELQQSFTVNIWI